MNSSPKITNEILDKILQQHSQYKRTRHRTQKIYNINQILNIHLKHCLYTGKSPNKSQYKTHLQIKFTSPDECGTICMSIPLEKYQEVIFHSTQTFEKYTQNEFGKTGHKI